jgi:endonuclease YncB( thermonuclease family)
VARLGSDAFGDLEKREAFRPLPRVLALLFLFLIGPAAAATLTGKADIVDADTIKIGGIPVRLYGIDAPESRQTCEQDGNTYACGKQATKALADLIAGEPVQCDIVGRDAFGRALGICSVADTELNATMVSHGWALAFVKFSGRYVANQKAAELAKAGLWAGSFIKPWEWRFAEAEAAQKTRTCVIKGNINREGARIYHLPSQYFYRRIKIDEKKGERWFCTEQEALEAGWRRSLR